MRTFRLKISAYDKRTRQSERQATAHVVKRLLPDLPEDRLPQAWRIIDKLKRPDPPRPQEWRGPFSGLTRVELAASGTCEPDWF